MHKIVEAIDANTGQPSDGVKHRVGWEVHVGQLSLYHPATFYRSAGITVTSPVKKWIEGVDGKLDIVTANTIYKLDSVNI